MVRQRVAVDIVDQHTDAGLANQLSQEFRQHGIFKVVKEKRPNNDVIPAMAEFRSKNVLCQEFDLRILRALAPGIVYDIRVGIDTRKVQGKVPGSSVFSQFPEQVSAAAAEIGDGYRVCPHAGLKHRADSGQGYVMTAQPPVDDVQFVEGLCHHVA